jgi:hypothetical protein
MALRKRYQGRLGEGRNDDKPVSVPPTAGAELPPVAEAKPAAPLEIEPSPVEQAARDAVKKRIAELQTETEQHEPVSRQPVVIERQDPTERIITNSGLPPRAQDWLRSHPDYITDPVKNAQMQKMHYVAEHQAGGQAFSDAYFRELESLLGFAPAASRNAAPVRQQLRSGPPVSAPISRDAPSWSTGRPASQPTRLTAEEDLARSLGLTPEQYRANKQKMIELKAAGVIVDGR